MAKVCSGCGAGPGKHHNPSCLLAPGIYEPVVTNRRGIANLVTNQGSCAGCGTQSTKQGRRCACHTQGDATMNSLVYNVDGIEDFNRPLSDFGIDSDFGMPVMNYAI